MSFLWYAPRKKGEDSLLDCRLGTVLTLRVRFGFILSTA